MNSSSSLVVPPPLGSAPPPSTANAALSPIHHKPVRASLSSLSSSQMSTSGEASTANMVNISNSNPGLSMDESWYRSNKIATAKTLQLQRQLSAGSFKTAGGSLTPSTEDFYREDPPIKPQMVPPTAAPRSIKPPLPTSSSTSGSSESLSSTSSPDPQKLEYQFETGKGNTDYQLEPSAILSEAAAASAASQAVMAAAAAKFGLETGKGNNTTSSSSSSTTSSRQRETSGSDEHCRRVRTLYACVGEHESELSFEPNQVLTDVRPSLEPGWLEGNLDGRRGLVPENYVEYIS